MYLTTMKKQQELQPQTIHEINIEIKVYEMLFKRREKEIQKIKDSGATYGRWHLILIDSYHIQEYLTLLYSKYMKLLTATKHPKLTFVYESKINFIK